MVYVIIYKFDWAIKLEKITDKICFKTNCTFIKMTKIYKLQINQNGLFLWDEGNSKKLYDQREVDAIQVQHSKYWIKSLNSHNLQKFQM